jgi:nicotinate-nucleotide pyrophosphorylase
MSAHLLVQECANCLLPSSGDVSCLATIPSEVEAEATFIAKADGVIAGISLADMIFNQSASFLVFQVFDRIQLTSTLLTVLS